MSRRWPAPFQGLRWRLTLSYTIVTVATLLVVEMALIGAVAVTVSALSGQPNVPAAMVQLAMTQMAPSLRPLLEHIAGGSCRRTDLAR